MSVLVRHCALGVGLGRPLEPAVFVLADKHPLRFLLGGCCLGAPSGVECGKQGLQNWAFPVEGPGVSRVLSVPYMKHGAPILAVVAMLL
jgi:hypothetical protein